MFTYIRDDNYYPGVSLQSSNLKMTKSRYFKHRKVLESNRYIKVIKKTTKKTIKFKTVSSVEATKLVQCPDFKDIENNEITKITSKLD